MRKVIAPEEAVGKTIEEVIDGGRVGSILFTDGTAMVLLARNSGYRVVTDLDELTLPELDAAGIYQGTDDWIRTQRASDRGVKFSDLAAIIS